MIHPGWILLLVLACAFWLLNPNNRRRSVAYWTLCASLVYLGWLIPPDDRHGRMGSLDPTPPMMLTTMTLDPPKQFHGDVRTIIALVDPDEVTRRCKSGREVLACQSGFGRNAYIVAPNPCDWDGGYASILCHELAHVNGWRHPQ